MTQPEQPKCKCERSLIALTVSLVVALCLVAEWATRETGKFTESLPPLISSRPHTVIIDRDIAKETQAVFTGKPGDWRRQ